MLGRIGLITKQSFILYLRGSICILLKIHDRTEFQAIKKFIDEAHFIQPLPASNYQLSFTTILFGSGTLLC